MKEYTVYFTFKCNWSCNYCIMDTHNQKEPKNILEKIKNIEENSFVSISGGEPGLGNKKIVNAVFKILLEKNCTIHLNTNGLFLEKFPHLLNYIQTITYHCSEYLDDINFKRYPHLKQLTYQLTISDEIVNKLENFILHNNDIKFIIFSADMIKNVDGTLNKFLSVKNIFKIYKQFKDNILPESYLKLFGKCKISSIQLY